MIRKKISWIGGKNELRQGKRRKQLNAIEKFNFVFEIASILQFKKMHSQHERLR